MTLMRFDPFREWDRFADQVLGSTRATRMMPMEAYRRGDEFIVSLDLPGVSPDDVEVTLERNVVNIKAHRTSPRKDGDDVLIDERPQGEFTRQLFLGDNLDVAKMSANFDRGVLTLTIPVAEKSKPRRVQIGTTDQQTQQIEMETGAGKHDRQPAHA